LVREGRDLTGTGLEPDSKEPLVYDLFAVDEHIGGLGGGHYRAYAKNTEDQQWYHFDDSHVQKAKPEDSVVSSSVRFFCAIAHGLTDWT
jgi:ubiquitin carboxyl-terminal hydrolase 4/11